MLLKNSELEARTSAVQSDQSRDCSLEEHHEPSNSHYEREGDMAIIEQHHKRNCMTNY